MFVVKDYLIVSGILQIESQAKSEQLIYEGTSSVQLSQDFVHWQSQGVPLICIPSLSLVHLEPGLYKVTISTSNGLTNALAGPYEYVHKIIYFGMMAIDPEYRSALSYNTLHYPISMNPNQRSFSITVKVEGITLHRNISHSNPGQLGGEAEDSANDVTTSTSNTLAAFHVPVAFLRQSFN